METPDKLYSKTFFISCNVTMCHLESVLFPNDNPVLVLSACPEYQHKGSQHGCPVSNRVCHATKGEDLIFPTCFRKKVRAQ